jgi:membrane-associated protease RseP (regulator of RpoE activity)
MRENEPSPTDSEGRLGVHLVLFVMTCLTTTYAGALYVNSSLSDADWGTRLRGLADGWSFSAALLGILLTHEMGHYLLAKKHRVDVSLPYFIPLPFGLGTLGAVIRMRETVRDRNALVDIGAAGPLAGLAVAIPVLAYGIHLSPLRLIGPGMLEGNSILYLLIKYGVTGAVLPGQGVDVGLHPVAWGGWVGLLVTMINLLPIGQLDGGHIAYGFFGVKQDGASSWFHRLLLPLGVGASLYTIFELKRHLPWAQAAAMGWMGGLHWCVWWLLLVGMRRMSGGQNHPPVDPGPLSAGRWWLCLLVLVVFILILVPIPLRPTLG